MTRELGRQWIACGVLVTVLSGCATFDKDLAWGSRIGIRPDAPSTSKLWEAGNPCDRFVIFAQYAKDLEEAYRTRATQNRTWIYVAGLTGLAVAAASGALAAATAVAAGTLALLSVSGGFTAGAFATINNTQLANVYDDASKEIGSAVATAEAAVFGAPPTTPAPAPAAPPAAVPPASAQPAPAQPAPAPPAPAQPGTDKPAKTPLASQAVCAAHLSELINAVSEARNKLDTARTDSAEGALIRATAGQGALKDIIAAQTTTDITGRNVKGQITKIDNVAGPFRVPAGGKLVALTVSNAPLDRAVPADLKIALGSKVIEMANAFPAKKGDDYEVMVQIPATPPDGDSVKTYVPALVYKGKQRIPAAQGLTIVYP